MNTSRVAVIAATTSAVAWTVKSVAIGIAGGLDRSPLESPLFLAGLLANVVAVIAIALALTHHRRHLARAGAVLAGIAAVFAFVAVVNLAIVRIQPVDASWVWSEVNLWVTAPVVLGAAVLAGRSTATPAAARSHRTGAAPAS